MDTLFKDIRFSIRSLLKHPAFAAISILTLALGIGANTAIFSVVNAVLLRPLAYREPERLVTILHANASPVAPANFLDWKQQNQSLASMAAAQWWEPNLTGKDQPEHLRGLQLTADMFQLLGIDPLLGRTFATGEDQPGRENVLVLGHAFWQRRFVGDRSVIGQQLTLDGKSFTIIGVMPPEFHFAPFWATHAEVWAPLNLAARHDDRGGQSLRVFGRLKQGVTRAQAQTEMQTINHRLEEQYPNDVKGLAVFVNPLLENVVGKTRPALLVLLTAVGFVLLIACANVANLMLARATSRQKEIALRMVLGAGRARIARQLLTESVILALAGGVFGLLLAVVVIKLLVSLGPASLPRLETIGLDPAVLAFTLVLSVLTGLLFGLAPVWQTRRANFNASLKDGARGSTDAGGRLGARRLLVISEMALAVMLLIGGGLLVRSFRQLRAIDPGFNPNHLMTMTVSLAGSQHSTGALRSAFFDQILPRIAAVPGVESASAINHLPIGGDLWTLGFTIEGQPAPPPGTTQGAVYRIIRPEYFRTMGATLLSGRDFNTHDHQTAPAVVMINEAMARRYWPNQNPLGRRIKINDEGVNPREIVGVVKDARQGDWTLAASPEVYLSHLQATEPHGLTLVVRTAGDPAAVVSGIQNEIWAVDKSLPVSEIKSMDEVIAEALGPQRFNMLLLGVFGGVALLLATVGIYGVMSNAVTSRTQEIGIRMALGAQAKDVMGMIVGQGMLLTVIGIGLGLVGAFFVTQLMSGLLYGVSATDQTTFVAVPVLLTVVAMFGCYVPARRATKVDPLVALRYE